MYRVLDASRLFSLLGKHIFGVESCRLMIKLRDTFLPENEGKTIVHFHDGRAVLQEDGYDVSIEMDVSDFSSLIMGTITFKKLYEFNLAKISDANYVEQISRLFLSDTQPICLTRF
jgi:predicted acetyltransferase